MSLVKRKLVGFRVSLMHFNAYETISYVVQRHIVNILSYSTFVVIHIITRTDQLFKRNNRPSLFYNMKVSQSGKSENF